MHNEPEGAVVEQCRCDFQRCSNVSSWTTQQRTSTDIAVVQGTEQQQRNRVRENRANFSKNISVSFDDDNNDNAIDKRNGVPENNSDRRRLASNKSSFSFHDDNDDNDIDAYSTMSIVQIVDCELQVEIESNDETPSWIDFDNDDDSYFYDDDDDEDSTETDIDGQGERLDCERRLSFSIASPSSPVPLKKPDSCFGLKLQECEDSSFSSRAEIPVQSEHPNDVVPTNDTAVGAPSIVQSDEDTSGWYPLTNQMSRSHVAKSPASTGFRHCLEASSPDDSEEGLSFVSEGQAINEDMLERSEAWQIVVDLPMLEELRRKQSGWAPPASITIVGRGDGGAGSASSATASDWLSSTNHNMDEEDDAASSLGRWTSCLDCKQHRVQGGAQHEENVDEADTQTSASTTRCMMSNQELRSVNTSSRQLLHAIRDCCMTIDSGLAVPPCEQMLVRVATELLTAHVELPDTLMVQMDRQEIVSLIANRFASVAIS